MTRLAILLVAAVLTGTAIAAQGVSPYAGQQQRSIKALSDREIEDLRAARGMGLAKAAELNSYPGPAHVRELAAQLHLTEAQRAATQTIFEAMRAKALPLGTQIIAAERALDSAFAQARITPEELRAHLRTIATLQAELRAVHLEAHIAQRALLNPEQIARYDMLRGYSSANEPGGNHLPGPQHRHHQ
jgi:Spy/CpxP family protein refolding chaperone